MRYTKGTKVVIVSDRPDHNWNYDMDKYLGQVMTIRRCGSFYYNMEEDRGERAINEGWQWEDDFIDHEATAKLNSADEESEYIDSYGIDYYTEKVYNMFDDLDRRGILFSDDCQYSKNGIEANVEEWYKQKSKLFSLFRKHPNWNEEAKAIVFLKTEHREPDPDSFCGYCREIIDLRQETVKADENGKNISPSGLMDEYFKSHSLKERMTNAGYEHTPYNENNILFAVLNAVNAMSEINILDERTARLINGFYPEVKAKSGMKSSRAINKIFTLFGFDKTAAYNRIFAKLSDSLNALDIERITVFSLNIIDFLMMSNGNSWRSCHTILDDGGNDNYNGCYKGGTLSYANDGVSIIMYTVDKNYKGTDWCFEPKITRQVFFWDYPVLVQERLYPQCNDDTEQGASLIKQYRTIAEEVIADCLGAPNLWVKENRDRASVDAARDTYMYHDWDCFNNYIVHIKNDVKISDSEIEEGDDSCWPQRNYVVRSAKKIIVGGKSYCTNCGSFKNYNDYYDSDSGKKTLLCADCCDDGTVKCSECGCRIDEDDAVTDRYGDYYCTDCCTYCEYHEQYEPNSDEDFTYVNGYGDVCREALENGDFFCCDECGEWYYGSDNSHECEGDTLCEGCFENCCAYCEGCGEPFYIRNMKNVDGSLCCECCAEEICEAAAEESVNEVVCNV